MLLASSLLPPLTRSPFPQRGRLISGSCFAVATINCFLYKYKRGSYNKPRPLGRGGPVRVSERGSSLTVLYGLARLVRVSCTVVVGIGALVGGQSKIESEFPPSVACRRHLPPKGTAHLWLLLRNRWGGGGILVAFASLYLQSYKKIPPRKRWDF